MGDCGDAAVKRSVELVGRGWFDELEAGEFGEGGEDEVVFVPEKEDGEAEGGLTRFAEADAGVEVAGDPGLIVGKVFWIVGDDEVVGENVGNNFQREISSGERAAAVVVSLGENDRNGNFFQPKMEGVENGGGQAVVRMNEVSRDDEGFGSGGRKENAETGKIGGGGALGNGDAMGAKGCGFAEVEVGDHEGF